jgi:uncharacterized surface protein with fasciclin (FAS1) repeats
VKQKFLTAALLALMGLSTSAFADNLLDAMSNDGGFKTFLSAVKTADMEDTLNAAGPMTVFAPTDFAFAALPKDKLDALLANKDALKKVISMHIVTHKVNKDDVDAGKVKTLEGEDVTVTVGGVVKINNVPFVGQGINADNGVIHALTAVLLPKS